MIIVEDIIDMGNIMYFFIFEFKVLELVFIVLVSLLVKLEVLEYDIFIDYIGFEIFNCFVVGYGFDYDGLGR